MVRFQDVERNLGERVVGPFVDRVLTAGAAARPGCARCLSQAGPRAMSALTRFAARDITVRRLRLSCSVAGGHRSQQAGGHGPAAVACVEMPLDRRPNRSRRKIPAGAGVPLRPQALNVVLDLATTVSTARCLTASLAWPQRNQDSRENSPLFRSDLVVTGYSIGDPCDGCAVFDELPLSGLADIQGKPVQLRTDG